MLFNLKTIFSYKKILTLLVLVFSIQKPCFLMDSKKNNPVLSESESESEIEDEPNAKDKNLTTSDSLKDVTDTKTDFPSSRLFHTNKTPKKSPSKSRISPEKKKSLLSPKKIPLEKRRLSFDDDCFIKKALNFKEELFEVFNDIDLNEALNDVRKINKLENKEKINLWNQLRGCLNKHKNSISKAKANKLYEELFSEIFSCFTKILPKPIIQNTKTIVYDASGNREFLLDVINKQTQLKQQKGKVFRKGIPKKRIILIYLDHILYPSADKETGIITGGHTLLKNSEGIKFTFNKQIYTKESKYIKPVTWKHNDQLKFSTVFLKTFINTKKDFIDKILTPIIKRIISNNSTNVAVNQTIYRIEVSEENFLDIMVKTSNFKENKNAYILEINTLHPILTINGNKIATILAKKTKIIDNAKTIPKEIVTICNNFPGINITANRKYDFKPFKTAPNEYVYFELENKCNFGHFSNF